VCGLFEFGSMVSGPLPRSLSVDVPAPSVRVGPSKPQRKTHGGAIASKRRLEQRMRRSDGM